MRYLIAARSRCDDMGTYHITDPTSFKNVMTQLENRISHKFEMSKTNAEEALYEVALDCLDKSAARAPLDTGTLRGSGYVTMNGENKFAGDTAVSERIVMSNAASDDVFAEATIGFSEVYANRQHEDVSLNHPIDGEAKYLEKTVVENADKWQQNIRDAAVKGFGEGS